MNIWKNKLDSVEPFKNFEEFPEFLPVFVFKYLGPFKKSFLVLTAIDIVHAVVIFLITVTISDALNKFSSTNPSEAFNSFLLKFIVLYMTTLVLAWTIRKWGHSLANTVSSYLAFRLYKTLLNINFANLAGFSKERLNSLIKFMGQTTSEFIGGRWIWGMTHEITIIILTFIIIGTRNLSVLLFDVAFFSLFVLTGLFLAKKAQEYSSQFYKAEVEASATISNFSLNLNTVKRLSLQAHSSDLIKKVILNLFDSTYKRMSFHSNRWFLLDFIYGIAFLSTISFFVHQVITAQVQPGYIVLLLTTIIQVKEVIEKVSEDIVSYIDFQARMKEFKLAMQELTIAKTNGKLISTFKKIDFQNVIFSITGPQNSKRIISIPSLRINKGENVAIIGPSGSGKTTILNMLLKQIEPTSGKILIDDQSTQNLKLDKNLCSVVASNDVLFNLSIRENIVLDDSYDEDKYQNIIRSLEILEFTSSLPNTDSSLIGRSHTVLSQGQEQRIRLARGLYKNAKLYLLDEPFNGLDSHLKGKIMSFVYEYLKDKTLVVITHNKEELKSIDKLYEFNKDFVLSLQK